MIYQDQEVSNPLFSGSKVLPLIATLAILSFVSCQGQQYGASQATGGNTQTGNALGYNPANYSGSANTTSTNSCKHGQWGGVTCRGNIGNDSQFLAYISNGTDSRPHSNSIGVINCKPSNSGGILFQMKVVLSSAFDPGGNNNNLSMQIASSSLKMLIYDGKSGSAPLEAEFRGLRGHVNGNKANVVFDYTGENGRKQVTLDGTFDNQVFTGQLHFENEKRLVPDSTPRQWTTPGAKGVLGDFRIPTCHVFTSN